MKAVYLSIISLLLSSLEAETFCVEPQQNHSTLQEMIDTTSVCIRQTNYNIDYQPYILSVWDQKTLQKFGVRTLFEALYLIPGVDFTTDNNNNRSLTIRGSNPLGFGQTKLIIDGVVVNDRTFDNYDPYLDFPLELIERIEVVRGSGSFIDGANGYSGTVNVITHAQHVNHQNELFSSLGSTQNRSMGVIYHTHTPSWSLATDAFTSSDHAHSPEKIDDTYPNNPANYAPLRTIYQGGGFRFESGSLMVQGRYNRRSSGAGFGAMFALPLLQDTQTNTAFYTEGVLTLPLTSSLLSQTTVGITRDSWEMSAQLLPPGSYPVDTQKYPTFPTTVLNVPEGCHAELHLDNELLYLKQAFTYTGLDNHTLSASLKSKWEHSYDLSDYRTNPLTGYGLTDHSTYIPFFLKDQAKRQ